MITAVQFAMHWWW